MKTKKITYVVFVTATLLSAMLLFMAVHFTDPLVLKYRATVSSLCAEDQSLENEADVLVVYPELSRAKDKIQALQQFRCQLQRMESNPTSTNELQRGKEMRRCKEQIALLIEEIDQLLSQVQRKPAFAQQL